MVRVPSRRAAGQSRLPTSSIETSPRPASRSICAKRTARAPFLEGRCGYFGEFDQGRVAIAARWRQHAPWRPVHAGRRVAPRFAPCTPGKSPARIRPVPRASAASRSAAVPPRGSVTCIGRPVYSFQLVAAEGWVFPIVCFLRGRCSLAYGLNSPPSGCRAPPPRHVGATQRKSATALHSPRPGHLQSPRCGDSSVHRPAGR